MNKNIKAIKEEWQAELDRTQGPTAPKVVIASTGKMLVCQDHWYRPDRVVEMVERLKKKPSFSATTGICKGCGCKIDPSCTYCGECLCEEDVP